MASISRYPIPPGSSYPLIGLELESPRLARQVEAAMGATILPARNWAFSEPHAGIARGL